MEPACAWSLEALIRTQLGSVRPCTAMYRRMHGLQFALRMAKKQGADKQALLNALEQRRLKLAA